MIHDTIARWHAHLRGELAGGLDELLHEDVVFHSPIVFSPIRGREMTKQYLGAAAVTFTGGGATESGPKEGSGFRYTKQVLSGDHAVLEFETTMGGKFVNGVDIITVDADGWIIEFRVMVRPLQAVHAVHELMGAQLAAAAAAATDERASEAGPADG